ncbi:hypothetical protein JCM9279_004540 [Rhodotorula babjevae]
MTTTRRLSGMQHGQGHQSTSLMLETYEAFKRKHLSQNKEIILKNSELHKTNADLQRQISLMRGERLALKGTQFQLECENAALRDRLDRADERERQLIDERDRLRQGPSSSYDPEQVEAMRRALANASAALQAVHLMLPTGATPMPSPDARTPYAPQAEPALAPVASTSTADPTADPNANISLSRRRSLAARAARSSMAAPPDLSNISEGTSGEDDVDPVPASTWDVQILPSMPAHAGPSTAAASGAAPPVASTSAALAGPVSPPSPPSPAVAPLSTLSRPARAPRAPPKAPSAASHDSLTPPPTASGSGASGSSSRPKRRVSGMLRPGLASAGSSEFGMAEEVDGEIEPAQDQDELESPSVPSTVEVRSTARGKRRASSLIAPPMLAASSSSSRSARIGRTPTPEPEREVEPVRFSDDEAAAEEEEERRRSTLREIQPAPRAELVVPSTAGKLKGKGKAVPVPPSAPRDDADEDLSHSLSSSRGAALLQAKKDAVRTQRAAATAPPVVDEAEADELEDPSASSLVAEETVLGPKSRTTKARRVEELEPLDEEGAGAGVRPDSQESVEEGAGGRRARKSVNYALPKLNTKMRRPEDYKPTIKAASSSSSSSGAKPRKSTKAPSSSSSLTSSHAAAPPLPPLDAPVQRAPSLAGKKPRVPPPPPVESPAAEDSTSSVDEDDAEWNEQQFLKRASSSTAGSARSSAMDGQRRGRQSAVPRSGSGAGGGAGLRRHSVAV